MADLQDYGLVEYRIEKQAASSKRFTESTNNRALGLWNGSEAIPFIKKLVGADTLLVRFTPYNDNKITAKFDISGLEKAIKPLRRNCNW
jgi:type VI secretion system protein VasI